MEQATIMLKMRFTPLEAQCEGEYTLMYRYSDQGMVSIRCSGYEFAIQPLGANSPERIILKDAEGKVIGTFPLDSPWLLIKSSLVQLIDPLALAETELKSQKSLDELRDKYFPESERKKKSSMPMMIMPMAAMGGEEEATPVSEPKQPYDGGMYH